MIPVRQVQKGDLIDFGGQPIPVLAVDVEGNLTTLWLPDGQMNRCDISFQCDVQITVQRANSDPEVEMVGSVAERWMLRDSGTKWSDASEMFREDYLRWTQQLVDAIRAAGYQVVKL